MRQRYLLPALVLLSIVAYCWSDWFASLWDPFQASVRSLPVWIAATMFSVGCLLPRDEVRQVIRRWPAILGGVSLQYTAMPLLAFTVGKLFQFDAATFTGIILVGCVPGAMASNVLTLAARGNVSYSVSLTTTATLLSPLVVPLTLTIMLGISRDDAIEGFKPGKASLMLLCTVVLPVIVGHLLSRSIKKVHRVAALIGPHVANLTILWIIAVVVGVNGAAKGVIRS